MYNTIRIAFTITIAFCTLIACNEKKVFSKADFVIANGQMPDIVKDKNDHLHLVYGVGDSIMYTSSSNKGISFSSPSLVDVLPGLFSFATRGTQVSATDHGVIITACTSKGNIYSYYKDDGKWKQGARVNDVDTVAKEGLMALSADGENAFAIWLDLRGNKKNKIYGAKSNDGGKSWSENQMIYTSPDTTVCECCKPSVIMKGNHVYVTFRNWLNGNRDLYLIQSSDGGGSFGQAQKLGTGSWKLNGCPMDGGGLAINQNGEVQTVWRRKNTIFAAIPGEPEKEIGEGRDCALEIVDNKNIYTWTEKGEVVLMNHNGEKKVLGKGSQPVLKGLDKDHVICVWGNEKQIHASIVEL
ncbi:MAG: exo-alpha-sialidase [Bacteroidetes bacterium]|nr:exo-alpha-sialidase [Bacteroidota bacterium]